MEASLAPLPGPNVAGNHVWYSGILSALNSTNSLSPSLEAMTASTVSWRERSSGCKSSGTLADAAAAGAVLASWAGAGALAETMITKSVTDNSARGRRVDLINHQIDDYSCDANVEPKRQRPSRNHPVFVEFFHPSAAYGKQNHRHDHDR